MNPKIYLVGGAVRDRLLGIGSKDRDYVVVGATPEWMIAQGYQKVGADFPVFLHPETKEEYALARQERKTGPGYHGFETRFDQAVTLEDDLARRDLTINSMAMDDKGNVVDPYGGQADLTARVLRHTSDAFVEDPLRVLRIARFVARNSFRIHESTIALAQKIVAAGELKHLPFERIWVELWKGFAEQHPQLMIFALDQMGALRVEPISWYFAPNVTLDEVNRRCSYAEVDKNTSPELYAAVTLNWMPEQNAVGKLRIPSSLWSTIRAAGILHQILRYSVITPEVAVELIRNVRYEAHRNEQFMKVAESAAAILCAGTEKNEYYHNIERLTVATDAVLSIDYKTLVENVPSKDRRAVVDAARLAAIKAVLF